MVHSISQQLFQHVAQLLAPRELQLSDALHLLEQLLDFFVRRSGFAFGDPHSVDKLRVVITLQPEFFAFLEEYGRPGFQSFKFLAQIASSVRLRQLLRDNEVLEATPYTCRQFVPLSILLEVFDRSSVLFFTNGS